MSVDHDELTIRAATCEDIDACVAILRSLPDWFGIEASIVHYAVEIPGLPTFVATSDGRVVGFLALKFHNEQSAEIYVLGVRAERHRRGIGTKLLKRAEHTVRDRGCRFFQVKTLGPSHPSLHYARTRRFYLAQGFFPLEELSNLWPGNPCLIMVKYLGS
jgi:ribosomal protein S18 acetylase RimI-like enzyme